MGSLGCGKILPEKNYQEYLPNVITNIKNDYFSSEF